MFTCGAADSVRRVIRAEMAGVRIQLFPVVAAVGAGVIFSEYHAPLNIAWRKFRWRGWAGEGRGSQPGAPGAPFYVARGPAGSIYRPNCRICAPFLASGVTFGEGDSRNVSGDAAL